MEGIIGSPRYLNPLLSQTNDADRDLVRIIFSSLFKYDDQGNLINDLAESYQIDESKKNYDIFIKKNIFWHDGKQLTADDVFYTIKTIQDSSYRSPLRANWQGIEVEKLDQFSIRLKLKNSYATFIQNLTFGILPKHVWQNISANDFALNEANLKPIGSGPYVFKKLDKNKEGAIKTIYLKAYNKYYGDGPFINDLTLKFYQDEDSAINDWKKGTLQGISYVSPFNLLSLKRDNGDLKTYSFRLPRYFSIFINQTQNKALADKNIRMALANAINKEELIEKVLNGHGQKVESPILPGMVGYSDQVKTYEFNQEKSKSILDAAGWTDGNNDGIREKEGQNLELSLVTTSWQELSQTADLLKDYWSKIGVKLNIEIKDISSIQEENIRPRQYQMLLFGELLSIDPDPFSFWHSSQKKDPGLNLSLYENPTVDAILQDARQDLDPVSRTKKYQQFSQTICDDLPAIFLYAPDYLYPVAGSIKGVDFKIVNMPSDRFSQIEKWYIKTKRDWK